MYFLRSPARWFVAWALFLSPRSTLAAPVEDATLTLTESDIAAVYNVANILSNRPRCPAGSNDLAAAGAFDRAASLLAVAARHYPPRPGPRTAAAIHARKRLVLVDEAVQLYEHAYQCAPGYPQRHHLERALDLIDAARQLVVDGDHLPPDAPELDALATRRKDLVVRLPTPPPPPAPPDFDLPPRREREAPVERRVRGRFVLRPELGVGIGSVTNQSETSRKTSRYSGIYGGLVAAARFPLGARAVHAFSFGGAFGVQQVAPLPDFETFSALRTIVQGGLHLEFALHAHPRWFSFHPMLDLGAQIYVGGEKFGRPHIAPALGLCIDRELVCFTARASAPFALPEQLDAKIFQAQFGLAVDLMRIPERRGD